MENNRKKGYNAEEAVAAYLSEKGYSIVKRNYYSRYGEIDIIAREGDLLVFVEVKYRRTNKFGTPAEAVTYSKQQKIINTAWFYLSENDIVDVGCRFDVAEVFGELGAYRINIIENAFTIS